MTFSDDSLRGRAVISADGLAIGEVTVLFINSQEWRVEALEIKLGKEVADRLGADRSFMHAGALEIPTSMIQSVGDSIVLSVGIDELRKDFPGGASESAPTY
jgi:sporulation protein YlmC with PRC-barrel domain